MQNQQIQGISIIIPCYNESPEVLLQTISEIKEGFTSKELDNYEIIVVNDGSKKFSYNINETNVRFISHNINRGYGAALKTGIRNATNNYIGITDADGTYPNRLFPEMLAHCHDYDMVVGARPWNQISAIRKIPKYLLTVVASFLANYKILDLNSGIRVFRKEMAMEFWGLYPNGFSFTSTITMGCITNGYTLKYIPVEYKIREGKSHIHPIKDTINFFSLITRLTMYFNPRRVFSPLSFIILLIAIVRGIRDYYFGGSLGGVCIILFFMAFQIFFFGLLAEIVVKTRSYSSK